MSNIACKIYSPFEVEDIVLHFSINCAIVHQQPKIIASAKMRPLSLCRDMPENVWEILCFSKSFSSIYFIGDPYNEKLVECDDESYKVIIKRLFN